MTDDREPFREAKRPSPREILAAVLEDWYDMSTSVPGVWDDFAKGLKEHDYTIMGPLDESAEDAWYANE